MMPRVGEPVVPSLATTLPSASESPAFPVAARYEVRRELARGGQSIVWVAFDRELGREVAFKMPRPAGDGSAGNDSEARFLREARITARLDHPNIVAVHEIGRTDDGRLFCAQRLVEGAEHGRARTLGQAMAETTSFGERLALLPRLLDVCNAIAFAHEAGVVHRDLKPDNVVLGRLGETVVLDWGLARDLHEEDRAPLQGAAVGQTVDGQVFGTPLYMSPEQAAGHRDQVGRGSDVWSLGVMLYELLAGVTPFTGSSMVAVIEQVLQAPVPKLLERAPQVPRALAAVVTRALERDETRRYPDAKALAADLRAFLAGRTVGAHDYSAVELLRLFVSRNRTATLVGAVSLLVLLVAVIALARAVKQNRESLAEAFVEKGRAAEALLRWEEASVWYAAARDSARREDASAGLRVVWPRVRHQSRLLAGHTGAVRALAGSPDGATLYSASADKTVRVWNVATGAVARVFEGHTLSVNALAITPDGALLFSGGEDDVVRSWKTTTGEGLVLQAMPDAVNGLAVSPDGALLAIGCEDGSVSLVTLATGQLQHLARHKHPVYAVAFSPDNALIASGAWDGTLEVRRVADGELVASLRGHAGSVLSLSFSPSGALLASAGRDTTVRLWKTQSWEEVRVLTGNNQKTYSVAWSRDESMIASAGADGTSRVWSGMFHLPFMSGSLGRNDELLATTFLAGGLLATGGRRGLIDLRSLDSSALLANHSDVTALTELDDGRLALQHNDGFAMVDAELKTVLAITPSSAPDAPATAYPARGVVLTRSGTLAIGSSDDASIRFFDVKSRALLALFGGHTDQVEGIAISPDDTIAASVARDGRLLVWDLKSLTLRASLPQSKDGLFGVAFSRDGALLATAGYDRRVNVYETRTWKLQRVLEGHEHGVRAVRFSPDGTLLASGGWDRSVRVWRVADGALLATMYSHQDQVNALDFSADGRRLASAGHDGTIRLWDLERFVEVVRFTPDEGRVGALLFSRDGRHLFYVRQGLHRIELVDENLPANLHEVLETTNLSMDGLRLKWTPKP